MTSISSRLAESVGGRLHEAGFPGPGGDLDAVAHTELVLDAGKVTLDRAQRDEQLARDLDVGAAPGDLPSHFSLALESGTIG